MANPENVIGKGTPFSSENQPDPKLISEGVKRWWDRRKLKNELIAEFSKSFVNDDGKKIQPFEDGVLLIKRAIFDYENDLTAKEKSELFLKFCDFVGVSEKSVDFKGAIDLTPKTIKLVYPENIDDD